MGLENFPKTEEKESKLSRLNAYLDSALENAKSYLSRDTKQKLTAGALLGIVAFGTGCDKITEFRKEIGENVAITDMISSHESHTQELYERYLKKHPELSITADSYTNFEHNYSEWSKWWDATRYESVAAADFKNNPYTYKAGDWIAFEKNNDLISSMIVMK